MAKVTSASASGISLVSSDVHVVNGAVWQDTELGDDGELWVESGGTALNTLVDQGDLTISTGGLASGVTVTGDNDENGFLEAYGGLLEDATFTSSGWGIIEQGGTAHTVLLTDGGYIEVAGTVNDATLRGGSMRVDSGATIRNVTLEQNGGMLIEAGATVTGVTLGQGASLVLQSDATFTNVTVASGGILGVDTVPADGVTIEDGGSLDFSALSWDDAVAAQIVGDPILDVTARGVTSSVTLDGDYTGEHFVLSSDGHGGTLATLEVDDGTPCYCAGTLITTDHGDIPVEALQIGDRVMTASGETRPIHWIGHRSYSGRFASRNPSVLPVIFTAGSLGNDLPRRDLWVSPLHAMFIDDVLIPAVLLVNGQTIRQAERVDRVHYFHVELESHDILLAEGAPAESFIDDSSRGMFHNAPEYTALYPDPQKKPARYCAPRVEEGILLETVRNRLNQTDGSDNTEKPSDSGHLEGYLDVVTHTEIRGWARWSDSAEPVPLRILDHGICIGAITADLTRQDVGMACGFRFIVPGGLSPHQRHMIDVQPVYGTGQLGHAPWGLDPVAETLAETRTTPPNSSNSLRGWVDLVSRDRIAGWAYNPATPEVPAPLQIVVNGQLRASTVANGRRPDVLQAGQGPENCGFDLLLVPPLSPLTRHTLEIRWAVNGSLLGAHAVLPPVDSFDPDLEQAVKTAVSSAESLETQNHVLSFLLEQVDRLKQVRAETATDHTRMALNRQLARRGYAEPVAPAPRALVIDSALPDGQRDAGSVAILSHIRTLQTLGYQVTFVAADGMGTRAPFRLPDVMLCNVPFYNSVEEVLTRHANSYDVVYLHREHVASRYMTLVRQTQHRARVVYAVADLHHVRVARQAVIEGRPELLATARRLKASEYEMARKADVVLTHSLAELDLLRRDVPSTTVVQVPWAVPVKKRVPAFQKRTGLAFIGNFAHAPNVDAAHWLVDEIMPLVWKQAPDIICHLVGSGMPGEIRRLASDRVHIRGHIPDLSSVMDQVRLTVAPLRFGAGIKGKVLDSLAAGVPCVMTPVASEGLILHDELKKLVATGNANLAQLIVRTHTNRDLFNQNSKAGQSYIRDQHNERCVVQSLQMVLRIASGLQQAG
ncbi:Hint domain-containing protein [Acetobacter sp. P1H12_c]|uniref:Hint domain-containing protein n=1 Tax=Acetobacter sp. P1H12_c TaxID=2762621 RepID=UPI001C03AB53|nr:Hint domain-containing protein [Acetobacter sp. P1H12_c]